MELKEKYLEQVSFPVGGIGAGCLGIAGNGAIGEWEVFNEAGKLTTNGYSHFAVRAEKDGRVVAIKVLQGDLTTEFTGRYMGRDAMFTGFGWGPILSTMAGFPHFRHCEMTGEFPEATWRFEDEEFPGKVTMTAWSRFIPGDSDQASLPVATFDITLRNDTADTLDYAFFGSLCNHWNIDTAKNTLLADEASGLRQLLLTNGLPKDDLGYGELALSMDGRDARAVSAQEYWYRGTWQDTIQVFWNDVSTPGTLPARSYTADAPRGSTADMGTLGAHVTLAPGESRTVEFIISWFVPNRSNTWTTPEVLEKRVSTSTNGRNFWRNYYAALCKDAADAARIAFRRSDSDRKAVDDFCRAMHDSTIPHYCLEGACENLAVLVSPTCLRLQNGELWGWEGVGTAKGSCEGSCQHVWNYAQALPLLFPDLERSIRETHAFHTVNSDGGWNFRVPLPLGTAIAPWHSCVDGLCGEVMKCYREWRVSGDTAWFRKMYPILKRAISFAWSPDNPDRWDPEKSGVLTGRQHHTLDRELYGPSGWLQSMYLGALKAMAAMARTMGDTDFAAEADSLYRKGRRWTEENLFNGEYYIQQTDITDRQKMLSYAGKYDGCDLTPEQRLTNLDRGYWDAEHGQIKYQIADGCVIDAHLGQLFAHLYGLGEILSPEQIRSTLLAIWKYNFKPSMRQLANAWRLYALNDEAGCIMCTWPHGNAPAIPLTYNSEVMTGFEWALATHLVLIGETEKAETLAKAIRQRYDGAKRNPWNEIECGSNYARAMAAFAMFQVFSGFQYNMPEKSIAFSPAVEGDFRTFWGLGSAWGTFHRHPDGTADLELLHGSLTLQTIGLPGISGVSLNGTSLAGKAENNRWQAKAPFALTTGDCLKLAR